MVRVKFLPKKTLRLTLTQVFVAAMNATDNDDAAVPTATAAEAVAVSTAATVAEKDRLALMKY